MKTSKVARLKFVKEWPSKVEGKPPSKIWKVQMENGDVGEMFLWSSDPEPTIGAQYEYDFVAAEKEGWENKINIKREPKPKKFGGGSSWTPERERSVMIQGLLKSIIEAGATQTQWDMLLGNAIDTHDRFMKMKPGPNPDPIKPRDVPGSGIGDDWANPPATNNDPF